MRGLTVPLWIIASGVILLILYVGREIFAPFAIAVFLWLVMQSFAKRIDDTLVVVPSWLSTILGIVLVLAGFGLVVVFLTQGLEDISGKSKLYETRINELIEQIYSLVGLSDAPTLSALLFGEAGQRFFSSLGSATTSLLENLILVLIYVGFLFLAASNWPTKLDAIFSDADAREKVRSVGADARRGIESYLWTQTIISVIITVLTYITLQVLGVENALLLSVLVFILNYIPTVGSIIAAFVPFLFAIAQPGWPSYMPENSYINAGIVFVAVSFWQFSIGNFVQPRMMGDTLNLSTLVVLLSLAVWGALWGIPGMFLSAPLTVILMVLFNQFASTRWIAVLLSADGKPGFRGKRK